MNPYNGFTGAQRTNANIWLKAQWMLGTLKKPTKCMSCGTDKGIIHAHAEDYSEPFAAGKTDQYHLCYACHMMVHCRFSNGRPAFLRYLHLLSQKKGVAPFMTGNWAGFKAEMLGSSITREIVPAPHATDLLSELFLSK